MARKPEGRAARKKTAKKTTSRSKIGEAQKAAAERRLERDTLKGKSDAERARLASGKNLQKDQNAPKVEAQQGIDPMGIIGNPVRRGELLAQGKVSENSRDQDSTNKAGESLNEASRKIAGLVIEARNGPKQPLANPDLYGPKHKDRATLISEVAAAQAQQKALALKNKGQAVFMGPGKITVGVPVRDRDTDKPTKTISGGETYLSKAELMSWLADPVKLDQIKAAGEKAGLDLQTTDDIMKLWTSVVDQAADSYSLAGKKVTPWSLIQLRGRYSVNGRPADKVTTSTTIDEMAPEQARMMFEQTAQQMLGRAPTKAEVDDFIAKAQTIARQNPEVRKTVSKIGFDGDVTDQTTTVTGGAEVVSAKAQVKALEEARQSEDYAAYQAAGNYFPMLFEALRAPV